MSDKTLSLREKLTELLEPYFQGEYGKMDTMLELTTDQIIQAVLARLPEKKSVDELKKIMGETPFTDLATWVSFKEGYNKSISEMEEGLGE